MCSTCYNILHFTLIFECRNNYFRVYHTGLQSLSHGSSQIIAWVFRVSGYYPEGWRFGPLPTDERRICWVISLPAWLNFEVNSHLILFNTMFHFSSKNACVQPLMGPELLASDPIIISQTYSGMPSLRSQAYSVMMINGLECRVSDLRPTPLWW